MNKLQKFFTDPKQYAALFVLKYGKRLLPDRTAIKIMFRTRSGKAPDLENPKTFNEKLQWLKLHDRNPAYRRMTDKITAKQFAAERIGPEHVVPLLGVWNSPRRIDCDKLPRRFVLKCNHDSRSWIFCENKDDFDWDSAKRTLRKKIRTSHFLKSREWAYKGIPRRILAEEYLEDPDDGSGFKGLTDYKFFCFDGVPKLMFVTHDIDPDSTFDAFDEDYGHLDMLKMFNEKTTPEKPACFEEMKAAAAKLSEGIPFVRVDFYQVRNRFYFGEMTFYPGGGFLPIFYTEWDYRLGEMIRLPGMDPDKEEEKRKQD